MGHDITHNRVPDRGESGGRRNPGTALLSSKPFLIGVAFAVLHVAVAWGAFGLNLPVREPAPVQASHSSNPVPSVGASASVTEALDLLYGELPLRMSDQEWRRDMTSACLMVRSASDDLRGSLADGSDARELVPVLGEMSGAAEELREAVENGSPEAAQRALARLDGCVLIWDERMSGEDVR